MDLKLINNSLLSLGSTISSYITTYCITAFVKDCPNISGIAILSQCSNLTRVRLDIGNVSGSISELMQYATLTGFNDNYEPQTKPRLVGTWTINDWYTQEQLIAAQSSFDGLTIVGDPNYLIDFSQLAVQTLDSSQPNYNPAAAIVIQAAGYGSTMTTPPISGQVGRFLLTKSDAANINIGTLFKEKTTLTDDGCIVTENATATYNFVSFNEFKYFMDTSISVDAFYNCTLLEYINIDKITVIGDNAFWGCTNLKLASLPSGLTSLGGAAFAKVTTFFDTIPAGIIEYSSCSTHVPYYGGTELLANTSSGILHFLGNMTKIDLSIGGAGRHLVGDQAIVHFNGSTVPVLTLSYVSSVHALKIYVGDGSSAAHDDAILQAYLVDTNWSSYSSKLDTYYNYLHPTT